MPTLGKGVQPSRSGVHPLYTARIAGEKACKHASPTQRIEALVELFLRRKSLVFRGWGPARGSKPAVVKTYPVPKRAWMCIIGSDPDARAERVRRKRPDWWTAYRKPLRPGLERDTSLMPWLIAEWVCGEAARYAVWTEVKTGVCYASPGHFRKLMVPLRPIGDNGQGRLADGVLPQIRVDSTLHTFICSRLTSALTSA